ncbi:MAG TPA: TetR/AcrR family transcriptional regulator [Acidimicrobiia bacterium]|nr:TetR/AcrR family transcriptional regulator [Acidimicrobiia bacterium]
MRRKLTQRGRDRRDQLLDHAARLFAERGYHPTAVSDIVASLGVGKGVFYWYFSSKEELLVEILKASHLDLRRRQQAAIGDEPDPVRRIELGIRASLAWFAQHREYFAIIQFAATDETFAPVLRRNREIGLADTIKHLKEAMVEHQIADQDPEVLANAIHGVVDQLTRRCVLERDEPVERVADAAVDFCLGGLRVSPAS